MPKYILRCCQSHTLYILQNVLKSGLLASFVSILNANHLFSNRNEEMPGCDQMVACIVICLLIIYKHL